ncbi:MAG: regulatory protein RecX [Bacteroidota bacterium]
MDILQKMGRYCAYQERCVQEVRQKLKKLECPEAAVEKIVARLLDEGFVDEARYARSFVRGKFGLKGWGKMKIRQALRMKGLDEELIASTLAAEVGVDQYRETVRKQALKKAGKDGWPAEWEARQKIKAFLLRKGFEFDVVNEVMAELGEE